MCCRDKSSGDNIHWYASQESREPPLTLVPDLGELLKDDSVINKDTLICQLKKDSRNSRKSLNRLKK